MNGKDNNGKATPSKVNGNATPANGSGKTNGTPALPVAQYDPNHSPSLISKAHQGPRHPSPIPLPEPPWGRMKGETERQYHLFQVFLSIPTDRTKISAFRIAYNKPNAKQAHKYYNQMTLQYRWVERAEAWDLHTAEQVAKQAITEARRAEAEWRNRRGKNTEENWTIGRLCRAVSASILNHAHTEMQNGAHPATLSPAHLGVATVLAKTGAELTNQAIETALNNNLPLPDGQKPFEVEDVNIRRTRLLSLVTRLAEQRGIRLLAGGHAKEQRAGDQTLTVEPG